MKKFLVVFLALGTLSVVPSVEAGNRKSKCHKPEKSCKKSCAPKKECHTEVEEEIEYRPCTKVIEVEGQCPFKKCTKTTTCVEKSEHCDGPCEVSCPDAVNPKNRGEQRGENE